MADELLLPYSTAGAEEPPNASIYTEPPRVVEPAPSLGADPRFADPAIRESAEHARTMNGKPDVYTETETTPGLLDGLANMKLDLSGLDRIGEAGKTIGFYVIAGLVLVLAIKLS